MLKRILVLHPVSLSKKKKKLFTLCCMCQESITIQQIRKDMIKKDLYRSTL